MSDDTKKPPPNPKGGTKPGKRPKGQGGTWEWRPRPPTPPTPPT